MKVDSIFGWQGAVALRHKMVEYKSTDSGARAVRDKKISAFICDYVVAQYFTQVGVAVAAAPAGCSKE